MSEQNDGFLSPDATVEIPVGDLLGDWNAIDKIRSEVIKYEPELEMRRLSEMLDETIAERDALREQVLHLQSLVENELRGVQPTSFGWKIGPNAPPHLWQKIREEKERQLALSKIAGQVQTLAQQSQLPWFVCGFPVVKSDKVLHTTRHGNESLIYVLGGSFDQCIFAVHATEPTTEQTDETFDGEPGTVKEQPEYQSEEQIEEARDWFQSLMGVAPDKSKKK